MGREGKGGKRRKGRGEKGREGGMEGRRGKNWSPHLSEYGCAPADRSLCCHSH